MKKIIKKLQISSDEREITKNHFSKTLELQGVNIHTQEQRKTIKKHPSFIKTNKAIQLILQ